MNANPMLEEIWRIKDQLAAESGHDVDRFFENLRKWEAEHPPTGQVIRNAEELRQLVAEKERELAKQTATAMALNDKSQQKKN